MQIIVRRGETVDFSQLPSKSIALDGYCRGPAIDTIQEKYSFDHHDNCLRLVTNATCRQVQDALLLGLDPSGFTVYVNDVDGDTVLSVWLLQHPKMAQDIRVRGMVEVVAGMDAHGPAYPSIDPFTVELFYEGIMAPERMARQHKTYGTCDLSALLEECLARLTDWSKYQFRYEPNHVQRSFAITHVGQGWVMATSEHFIFDLLYEAGHTAAIAYQDLGEKGFLYTLGKKSDFVRFPVKGILDELNRMEPGWGGGSTIGGAPRNADGSRSRLTPAQVIEAVQRVLSPR